MSAITGAAPVPVPPPMPAVMNSMSDALDHLGDAVAVLHRGVAADLRPGAGTQAARQRRAQLQLRARRRALQRLRVGIRADELDASQPSLDHVLHRVAAAASDTDDLDDCAVLAGPGR